MQHFIPLTTRTRKPEYARDLSRSRRSSPVLFFLILTTMKSAPLKDLPSSSGPAHAGPPSWTTATLLHPLTLSSCNHEDLCPWCILRLEKSFRAWLCLSLFSTASYAPLGPKHLCKFDFPVTRTDDKLNREGYKYFFVQNA